MKQACARWHAAWPPSAATWRCKWCSSGRRRAARRCWLGYLWAAAVAAAASSTTCRHRWKRRRHVPRLVRMWQPTVSPRRRWPLCAACKRRTAGGAACWCSRHPLLGAAAACSCGRSCCRWLAHRRRRQPWPVPQAATPGGSCSPPCVAGQRLLSLQQQQRSARALPASRLDGSAGCAGRGTTAQQSRRSRRPAVVPAARRLMPAPAQATATTQTAAATVPPAVGSWPTAQPGTRLGACQGRRAWQQIAAAGKPAGASRPALASRRCCAGRAACKSCARQLRRQWRQRAAAASALPPGLQLGPPQRQLLRWRWPAGRSSVQEGCRWACLLMACQRQLGRGSSTERCWAGTWRSQLWWMMR